MAEITNADLNALADRITESTRHENKLTRESLQREIALMREESAKDIRGVYHQIHELREYQRNQNGKVDKNTAAIIELRADTDNLAERVTTCEATDRAHGEAISVLKNTFGPTPDWRAKAKQAGIMSGLFTLAIGVVEVAKAILQYLTSSATPPTP